MFSCYGGGRLRDTQQTGRHDSKAKLKPFGRPSQASEDSESTTRTVGNWAQHTNHIDNTFPGNRLPLTVESGPREDRTRQEAAKSGPCCSCTCELRRERNRRRARTPSREGSRCHPLLLLHFWPPKKGGAASLTSTVRGRGKLSGYKNTSRKAHVSSCLGSVSKTAKMNRFQEQRRDLLGSKIYSFVEILQASRRTLETETIQFEQSDETAASTTPSLRLSSASRHSQNAHGRELVKNPIGQRSDRVAVQGPVGGSGKRIRRRRSSGRMSMKTSPSCLAGSEGSMVRPGGRQRPNNDLNDVITAYGHFRSAAAAHTCRIGIYSSN